MLFRSGILLSGMGADGAEGLLALRRAGWYTIAQDKATSVIYGMPKAAAQLNAAVEILPIDDIAAATPMEGVDQLEVKVVTARPLSANERETLVRRTEERLNSQET